MRCLDMQVFGDGSTFNFAYNAGDWGYPQRFEQTSWLKTDELKKFLLEIEGSDAQGDIFVEAPA
jgi:hypothetical protein